MKRQALKFLSGVLFLICTAMSCEDDAPHVESVSGTLTDFQLTHLDNAAERPKEAIDGRVKKEAYMLKISLMSEPEENLSSIDKSRVNFLLHDPIVNIRIFTETNFREDYPADSDISSLFANYPIRIVAGQLADDDGSLKWVDESSYLFKSLLTAPVQSGTYLFRVRLIFKSGDIMEKTTEPIVLY